MDHKTGVRHEISDLETRVLAPRHALIIGAVGGALAILSYKTCELLVRGLMGGGYQFTPSEKVTTIILVIVIACLIYLLPSEQRQIEQLRAENDRQLDELREKLESLKRERT